MKRSFDILYEDKEILVVYKKSGLLTIGTDKDPTHNLYHYVREYLNSKRQKAFIVHRLDKDTSGILIFSKSPWIKEKLQKAFEEGTVTRLYEAIVSEKNLKRQNYHVEEYLAFDPKSGNVYVTKDHENGKKAITLMKVDHENSLGTVLRIKILTGRRNQIRLALKTVSLTLLGDKKYGNKEDKKTKRMFLNAYYLAFPESLHLRQNVFSVKPLWLSTTEEDTVDKNLQNSSKLK